MDIRQESGITLPPAGDGDGGESANGRDSKSQ